MSDRRMNRASSGAHKSPAELTDGVRHATVTGRAPREPRAPRAERSRLLKQQHQLFVALFGALDGMVITLACFGAWAVRRAAVEGYFPRGWESWVKGPLFIFVVPIVLACLWAFGLYQPRRDFSIWTEQRAILKTVAVSVGAVIVLMWGVRNNAVIPDQTPTTRMLGHNVDGGRVQLAVLAPVLMLGLSLHRAAARIVLREVRRRGRNLRHVAVVGVGRLGQ